MHKHRKISYTCLENTFYNVAFGSKGSKEVGGIYYVDETIREENNWLGKLVLLARKGETNKGNQHVIGSVQIHR